MGCRKIGVIMPAISDMLDYDLLQGIYKKAEELGYSTIVFTSASNIHEDESELDRYISGQENIYSLVVGAELDGILVAGGRFFNSRLKEKIYAMLRNIGIPCIAAGERRGDFSYVLVPQKEYIEEITAHLINEHNCRVIYCLTGPEGDFEAKERLCGYCSAMDNAGLKYDNYIFYGDFWFESAKKLAHQIISGEIARPDGIVCANDIMANAVCDTLIKGGYRVPEDIRVTGYDGSLYAHIHHPTITTVSGKELCLGELAVCRIHELITGERAEQSKFSQGFCGGESCGCSKSHQFAEGQDKIFDYFKNLVWRQLERKQYITSNHIARLSDAENLAELVMNIDVFSGMLSGWTHFDLCLCMDWVMPFEKTDMYRRAGYSDDMLLILSRSGDHSDMGQYEFPKKYILPRIKNTEKPAITVVTSLHNEDQIFGYVATEYESVNEICVDDHYVNWCDAISNGLKNLQKRYYSDFVRAQLETKSIYDFSTGLYNRRGFWEQFQGFENREITAIAIYCRKKETSYEEIDAVMVIADVLRSMETPEEITARIAHDIFMVVYPEDRKNAELWMAEFRCRMESIRKEVSFAAVDELFYEYFAIQADCFCEDELDLLCRRVREKGDQANKSTTYMEILHKIRNEIRFSPQENWSVPNIAQKAGLSLSYFHRLYKEQFGISCMEDIISARILKAKHLLLNTKLSVHEISEQCGYSNASHFMRQFKEREGVSAMNFRRGVL